MRYAILEDVSTIESHSLALKLFAIVWSLVTSGVSPSLGAWGDQ